MRLYISPASSEIMPNTDGEQHEAIELKSRTGGSVAISLTTVEQTTDLLDAVTAALARLQERATPQQDALT